MLGKKVKDKVTGFIGIATSKHIYLTGCTQFGLQPEVNEKGKVPDAGFFDEGRLVVLGDGFNPEDVEGDEPGCDHRERP